MWATSSLDGSQVVCSLISPTPFRCVVRLHKSSAGAMGKMSNSEIQETSARRRSFWTLPVPPRGSSATTTTRRGTL